MKERSTILSVLYSKQRDLIITMNKAYTCFILFLCMLLSASAATQNRRFHDFGLHIRGGRKSTSADAETLKEIPNRSHSKSQDRRSEPLGEEYRQDAKLTKSRKAKKLATKKVSGRASRKGNRSLKELTKLFFLSMVDPTCGGEIEIHTSSVPSSSNVKSDSAFAWSASAGAGGGSFGPVCGPNGCH